MIDLTVLGCGGGMPMPNRHLSSVIISVKGHKILVDCGEGTQVSMRKNGCGFKNIEVICITHVHGDHIVGLPGLLSTIGNSGREETITIIGPKGISDVINGLKVIFPYLPYKLNIVEQKGTEKFSTVITEKFKEEMVISTINLEHSSPCIGFKFHIKRNPKFNVEKAIKNNIPKQLWSKLQKGQQIDLNGVVYTPDMVMGEERSGINISYITDTRPLDYIPVFIKDSDLFICEGTYGSNKDLDKAIKNKHMTFKEAAILALEGNVKELLITHFSPALVNPEKCKSNATDIFFNSDLAYDGMVKTLSFT